MQRLRWTSSESSPSTVSTASLAPRPLVLRTQPVQYEGTNRAEVSAIGFSLGPHSHILPHRGCIKNLLLLPTALFALVFHLSSFFLSIFTSDVLHPPTRLCQSAFLSSFLSLFFETLHLTMRSLVCT